MLFKSYRSISSTTTGTHSYTACFFCLQVADSKGHILYSQENAPEKGKFAFTTEDYDMFEVCFHSSGMH